MRILCLFIMLLLPGVLYADDIQTSHGIRWACTGVGESKEDPRWEKFPLKLMFAARGNAYVSAVKVEIQDKSKKPTFSAECDAPWILVDLAPGTYQVHATALGRFRQSTQVTLRGGPQVLQVIRFPQITGE